MPPGQTMAMSLLLQQMKKGRYGGGVGHFEPSLLTSFYFFVRKLKTLNKFKEEELNTRLAFIKSGEVNDASALEDFEKLQISPGYYLTNE